MKIFKESLYHNTEDSSFGKTSYGVKGYEITQ